MINVTFSWISLWLGFLEYIAILYFYDTFSWQCRFLKIKVPEGGGEKMKDSLSMFAGMLFLISFLPYMKGILSRETKPMLSSWIVWITLDWITAYAMFDKGVLNWQMIAVLVGGTLTLLLSFVYGEKKFSMLDYFCLACAFLGVLLGYYIDSLYALFVSQGTILIGSLPTIISAYKVPANESKTAWMLNFVSCVLQVGALKSLKVEEILQPLNFLLIQGIMVYLLWVPRKQKV